MNRDLISCWKNLLCSKHEFVFLFFFNKMTLDCFSQCFLFRNTNIRFDIVKLGQLQMLHNTIVKHSKAIKQRASQGT